MNDQLRPDIETISGDVSVSELTGILKRLIEGALPVVSVVGEVSNYTHHSSGHRYFTLKDGSSQLRCVMFKWQAARLGFAPEEGMMLRAVGSVTVYERGGQYQLNVVRLEQLGRGDLLARLEELKARLDAEGVFANERTLPRFPRTVGVVTSPTGAAVRDIIAVIRRRAPQVQIILRPALVQGEGAAPDIVRAIEELNTHGHAEVLIVGRGGGSIEDLWCFNDEQVARTIHASSIPVVSAVGHETDVTLADFAADLRAPTPSAAAELVVPDTLMIRQQLAGTKALLVRVMHGMLESYEQRVRTVRTGLSTDRFLDRIMMRGQQVDEYGLRMKSALDARLHENERRLMELSGKLGGMNPRDVLDRGYALVTRADDRELITTTKQVTAGERITVELSRGSLQAEVLKTDD